MNFKTKACLALTALLAAAGLHAEILAWQSNPEMRVRRILTVRESVTGLASVTAKPLRTTDTVLEAEGADAAGRPYAWLEGIPSFPETDISPGAKWTGTGTVILDLSPFGHTVPVRITVPVSYTFVGVTELAGRTLCRLEAEWYPLFLPSRVIAKRTGIARLSGASRMELYWDNGAGRPDKSNLTEEIQYRFAENTALLFTRETGLELKETVK